MKYYAFYVISRAEFRLELNITQWKSNSISMGHPTSMLTIKPHETRYKNFAFLVFKAVSTENKTHYLAVIGLQDSLAKHYVITKNKHS